ncbi:MAG: cysteine--tRNA ligase [Candidatus Staskawiczbacteria bacterium RIFCSPHIGHO2_02_FULL_43_16]|uniref:Cysteine--tRNA ligase n=1 Tax=Candidatus Staskawiczbacteria bacterium RIFCSPHIGHO2_01_FULL_41_41 TaxID=1802203 RepID=A0A1G2HU49_9BACT|nr:MAG: cysteine--tRNA ligase [Candidatus Staskawiczbacteria bacterium RIFCSPHIGHO2_01_FULL_41_41]OGZ68703.1 MAG: cysteine--tRNA ligase [Candidatus Staskawiczbacteria bacterium RIFCSPHIGHO2_02_FULL_43_16]OGZ75165.1 MAG: cysteine--tRNA ligase [Candidatus Staskawiczbacteria bacterium RIFCSPLOWO2_01_FULL_43_17b]
MKPAPIKIYNTLSGKKELLKPINGKRINLFVCGPTVYDFIHLGNAKTIIIFDCFAKYLKAVGYDVFYLQNITDIDDKIIARAKEKGVSPKDLAEAFTKEYFKNMKALQVDSVKKYAKATDYIKEIIQQVTILQEKGFVYGLEDGLYFDISKFKGYGKLSGRTALAAEDSVSRIDYSKNKKNRGDFCVWKFAAEYEPSWPSPFGAGRPGWHIEDTAITETFFGPQYDIHGGGRDLMFPHHEAEITQMEAISGLTPMASHWMHTGFLTINGQKMSKSLNNFVFIDDFLKRYTCQQLRFWIAKNLWSSPIDYSESTMMGVAGGLEKMEEMLRKLRNTKFKTLNSKQIQISKLLKKVKSDFYGALADNFNTPEAFAAVFEFMKAINPLLDANGLAKKDAVKIVEFFKEIDKVFGIIDFKKLAKSNIPAEVKKLVKLREGFRKTKEWQKSDETRQEIEKYGYTVQDTGDGPILKKI